MTRQILSYGRWPSPITAEHVAAAGRKFTDLCVDPAAPDALYWIESLPQEAGRNSIMRQQPGAAAAAVLDREGTRLNSSHASYSYAVFGLKTSNEKNRA